jgi:branched-chain amino acid transport system substrate-binding protein
MTKTGKILVGVIVLVIIIWIVVANVGKGKSSGVVKQEPIKIGFVGPLTGDVAGLGTVSRAAVELAAEEINAADGIGGRQVQVIYEDTKCSPSPATSAVQKLINVDKVSAIIGGLCSSETSAFAPMAMQSKVVTVSYCSSAPALSSAGKYFFRTYPSDSYQGIFAADYAYNTMKARKVAIIYHVSDWGTGIKDVFVQEFEKLGGKVVDVEGTAQDVRDYRTQIAKIKSSGFDTLYLPVYSDGGTALIKQLADAKVPTSKILGPEVFNDPKFLTDTKGSADGITITASKISPSEDFKTKLLAKTGGKEVPICAPEAYDAFQAVAKGLLAGGTDGDKLQESIRALDFTGQSGQISFDEHGDLKTANYVISKISNGAIVEVK